MIEVALDLFHQKGIIATSVDEILEKSGTGKGQFYHYFKNKEDLIHEVLQYFYQQLRNEQLPPKINLETWTDLENWFDVFIDFEKSIKCKRSCPIGTIGSDLGDSQDLLRQDIKLVFEFTRYCLSRFFVGLKAKNQLPKSIDPGTLADLCFTVQQGGMLVSKIERNCDPFERSARQLLKLLKDLTISG